MYASATAELKNYLVCLMLNTLYRVGVQDRTTSLFDSVAESQEQNHEEKPQLPTFVPSAKNQPVGIERNWKCNKDFIPNPEPYMMQIQIKAAFPFLKLKLQNLFQSREVLDIFHTLNTTSDKCLCLPGKGTGKYLACIMVKFCCKIVKSFSVLRYSQAKALSNTYV